jgi:hypothetical protein
MMNASPTRKYCAALLPLAALLALCVSAPLAHAQTAPPTSPSTGAPPAPKLFTLDIRAARLRDALEVLFEQGKIQFSIEEDIPDKTVTLRVKDQPIDDVLPLMLKQASTPEKRLTYTIERGVYNVRVAPSSRVPLQWIKIVLKNTRPSVIMPRVRESFPDASSIISHDADSALLIEAPGDKMRAVEEIVKMLDVAPRNVILKAEVVMVTDGSTDAAAKPRADRNVLLATVLRTASGQETDGEDKITGTPSQTARLGLVATATRLGDGNYEVQTRWDVSLPLMTASASAPVARLQSYASTAKPGASRQNKASGTATRTESLVRLEKRLSNTSRFRSGDTNVVGGIVLSQYGLKGQILFFVTLTEVQDTPSKP